MKKQLTIKLAGLFIFAIISVTSKAQPNGTTTAKRNKVLDSLHITDPGEQKVLALYDDCISEYLTDWSKLASNPSSATTAQRNDIEKSYQARAKALKPDIDALRQKLVSNNAELMKFVQFSQYESQRMMVLLPKYQQALMKNAGH